MQPLELKNRINSHQKITNMASRETKASKKKNVQVAVRVRWIISLVNFNLNRPMNEAENDGKGRPIVKVDYVAKTIGLKDKTGLKTFGSFDKVSLKEGELCIQIIF